MKKFRIEDLLERKAIDADNHNVKEIHLNKNILITGGAGSIGSELARQICQLNPKKIVILDQSETALNDLMLDISESYPQIQVEYILGDISNKKKVELVFSQNNFDIVYHAAAYKHVPMMEKNPCEGIRVNVLGTKNVAEISIKYSVERFVMISTDKAVNPVSVMGATKRVAELLVQNLQNKTSQTDFIITRFGNVLASNGSVLLRFQKQIEERKPLTITHSDITRYFMTIAESCQLVLEAGAIAQRGEICVFDMGEPIKIVDLAKKMAELYGLDLEKDLGINFVGLRQGDKFYEELFNPQKEKQIREERQILVFKPVDSELDNDLECKIEKLITTSEKGEDADVLSQLNEIVPEYQNAL